MKVAAYLLAGNGGAQRAVPAMVKGAEVCGESVKIMSDAKYCPEHVQEYDAAIFWGFTTELQQVMKGFTEAGKPAVYIDLAYWERDTHYKVAVGARHPTAYFQKFKHDEVRRRRFGVEIQSYSINGTYILVAGLSQKAAWAEHEGPWGEYESQAIAEIKKYTDRPIIYRAKTSGSAAPIPGTRLSTLKEPLGPILAKTWAVVTRHSNVAVDGLVVGVPAFAWYGIASKLALQDLAKIETPWYPEGREQFINDASYTQWSVEEMQDGTCWRHLKQEGLV